MESEHGILWYLGWWGMIALQGASFTWVSRARNSGSVAYATMAGCFSHSLWFVGQVFLVTSIVAAAREESWPLMLAACAVYTSAMVAGQAGAMCLTMRFLETGSRRVGARLS